MSLESRSTGNSECTMAVDCWGPNKVAAEAPKRLFSYEANEDPSIQRFSYDDALKFNIDDIEHCQSNGKHMVRLLGRIIKLQNEFNGEMNLDTQFSCWFDDGTSGLLIQINPRSTEAQKAFLIELKAGDLVECVGFLIKQCNEGANAIRLLANTITRQEDSNLEFLRYSEILQQHCNIERGLVSSPDFPSFGNVSVPSSPMDADSASSFYTKASQGCKLYNQNGFDNAKVRANATKVEVNLEHLLQLISYFAPELGAGEEGGIKECDLALMLGVAGQVDMYGLNQYLLHPSPVMVAHDSTRTRLKRNKDTGQQALQLGLETLQASGQIYLGSGGCYLPL